MRLFTYLQQLIIEFFLLIRKIVKIDDIFIYIFTCIQALLTILHLSRLLFSNCICIRISIIDITIVIIIIKSIGVSTSRKLI